MSGKVKARAAVVVVITARWPFRSGWRVEWRWVRVAGDYWQAGGVPVFLSMRYLLFDWWCGVARAATPACAHS